METIESIECIDIKDDIEYTEVSRDATGFIE